MGLGVKIKNRFQTNSSKKSKKSFMLSEESMRQLDFLSEYLQKKDLGEVMEFMINEVYNELYNIKKKEEKKLNVLDN